MRTKDKRFDRLYQSGNAMIYVLIALALFGALTLTLSEQNDQADSDDLNQELVELYAGNLIEYAASAQNVIDQMIITGSTIDNIDFINPSSAGFNTAPNIHKVYHPAGGGLNYKGDDYLDEYWEAATERGWQHMTGQNVEWTSTTATDIMFSFMDLDQAICESINETLTGSTAIPALDTGVDLDNIFNVTDAAAAEDFDAVDCATPAECDGYPSLCVSDDGAANFVFYNIVAAR